MTTELHHSCSYMTTELHHSCTVTWQLNCTTVVVTWQLNCTTVVLLHDNWTAPQLSTTWSWTALYLDCRAEIMVVVNLCWAGRHLVVVVNLCWAGRHLLVIVLQQVPGGSGLSPQVFNHSSSSSAFPATSLRFTTLADTLAHVTVFNKKSKHRGSLIPSSWMVHAGCVFVAGIHSSRAWLSGSFQSVWSNACVHRLDLGLYSHPKEFYGMESEPMLTPKEKSPLPETQRRVKPATLHHAGQRTKHTTDWAILAWLNHSIQPTTKRWQQHTADCYELCTTPILAKNIDRPGTRIRLLSN